jgi:hypothetical protein
VSLHRLFLVIWLLDLVVIPALAVLQLGFSFGFVSNYFARFSYIGVLGCAVFYHLLYRRHLVVPSLSMVFVVIGFIGAAKGAFEGQLNSAFLAHVFYCAMPVVMISFGWYFRGTYEVTPRLRRDLRLVMRWGFYVGVLASALFLYGYWSGLAAYNALGLWNFFFAGPFLAYHPHGAVYFVLSVLGAAVTAKKSTLVVFVVYVFLYVLLMRKRARRFTLVMAPVAVGVALLVLGSALTLAESRISQSLEFLRAGDFDTASAGRWSESAAAFRHLSARWDHLAFGAGFGATFLPWPDTPDYEDYRVHYTHFGFMSYMWLGGVLAPVVVYVLLIKTNIQLLLKAKRHLIPRRDYAFPIWLAGIVTVSLFGAVLMNNSYLWFVIGCCLKLNTVSGREPAAVTADR